jgi:Uma2 family endonuclease
MLRIHHAIGGYHFVMRSAGHLRLTNADLECMRDNGKRCELIDGELYVSDPSDFVDQSTLINIASASAECLRDHQIGRILPGVGVIFDDYNGVIPDLIFITYERMRKTLREDRFYGAPEIMIEILSPGTSNERRDRDVKLSLYASNGVGEYWIVDPENRSVEVYRRNEAGNLAFENCLRQTDELTCAFLPGFAVSVDKFFV